MRPMTRWWWLIAPLLGLAGCSTLAPTDSKGEAQTRWNGVRGQIKYQMAAESFAAGRLDKAESQLQEAVGLDPEASEPYLLLARLRLERGETAAAADAVEQAVRNGGDGHETDYFNGVIAQRYGRFAIALEWYQRASDRAPNYAHYLAATAEMLVALDQAAEALRLVRSRWTDFEQNAQLRSLAGEIYLLLGRYEDAAIAFRSASYLTPGDRVLQYQLGTALAMSRHYGEARKVLAGAVGASGPAPASALMALSRCELALGRPAAAKTVLRRLLDQDPRHARGWSWLARTSLQMDDLMTARRAAKRAVELESDHPDHALLLGYVCWRQEDYVTAITWLERVLQAKPDEPLALCLLGQCREALDDPEAARRCYQRALKMNPRFTWAHHLLTSGTSSDVMRLPQGG